MYSNSKTVIPYYDIDIELRDLIRCLNELDGIETVECCVGHGEHPCWIWGKAESIKAMNNLLFNYFDTDRLWQIRFDVSDVNRDWEDIHFWITSGEYKDETLVSALVSELTWRFKARKAGLKRFDHDLWVAEPPGDRSLGTH